MFINYFDDATRSTPLNVAVARIVLSVYVLWRSAAIDARAIIEWPVAVYPFTTYLYPPAGFEWILVVEKWLLILFATLLLIGYRTRLHSFLTGLLLVHLTGAIMMFNRSGETQQLAIASMLILLFGLYTEQDEISVDGFRRTRNLSLHELNETLNGSVQNSFRMDGLKYMLLTLGILYAGSAWAKINVVGLFTWTDPDSLARHIRYYRDLFRGAPPLADLMIDTPELLAVSTWGTFALEFGLLAAILAGVTITPVVLLLLGMHTGIVLTMGIFFFDLYFLLVLFAAFDRGYARLVTDREIELVYDERCFLCARGLYIFKLLDINETVTFYTQYNAPAKYKRREGVTFDDEIYVFVNGDAYGGYWAFREILRQFWVTIPLTWVMALPPVAAVGEQLYEYIAENRSQYFVSEGESREST